MRYWKQCHRYRYAHQVFVQVHVSNSEPYPQKGPQPPREKMGLKVEFPSAAPGAEVAALLWKSCINATLQPGCFEVNWGTKKSLFQYHHTVL